MENEENKNIVPEETAPESTTDETNKIPLPDNNDPLKGVSEQAIIALTRSISSRLELDYQKKFEVWKSQELGALEDRQNERIDGAVKDYIKQLEEQRKPPTDEEIEQLLNQEYKTFKIKIKEMSGEAEKEFAIRELPMDCEQQFFRQFKDSINKRASEIASLIQRAMDMPKEKQIEFMLKSMDDMFDMIADATAISLNPLKEEAGINRKWVKENISSMRQWNICQAQIRVNRLRDFFYQLYQTGTQVSSMTTGLNSQDLLGQPAK